MEQPKRAKDCLQWIEKEYGISFNDRFNIVDLVFEYIEKNENKINEPKHLDGFSDNNKKPEKNVPLVENNNDRFHDVDYYEENIDGRVWYKIAH